MERVNFFQIIDIKFEKHVHIINVSPSKLNATKA